MNYTSLLSCSEYDFLKTNEHLGGNIILLGLGGSHAYGTNVPGSDIDIRGVALNTKKEILLGNGFEQVEDYNTDTVIYSFNKIISLLCNCNPNVIEMLGLRPEHYLYLSPIGQQLLDNKELFLSKKAAQSFGGYATSQLRRLDNKAVRLVNQSDREKHILNSINNAKATFPDKYFTLPEDGIKLYIDTAVQEDYDTEIFMDVHLTHYPLRDYKAMWSEMHNIVKDYSKIGKRNKHAIEHGKLGKHMCHLIRLYYMCLDILENEQIITYRETEHDLLMKLRYGEFLNEQSLPTSDFYDLLNDLEKRLIYAQKNTSLPNAPDYTRINEFIININERIVKNEI